MLLLNYARQATKDLNVEVTVGADKGSDEFIQAIQACLEMKVTPHVAQNTSGRRSAVPDDIACSAGYAVSQQKRKLAKNAGKVDAVTLSFRIVKHSGLALRERPHRLRGEYFSGLLVLRPRNNFT